jgi:MerR family regulatory protein
MAPSLTIGQVAKTSGIAAKTIRYYEQIGVLPAPPGHVRLPTLRSARRGAAAIHPSSSLAGTTASRAQGTVGHAQRWGAAGSPSSASWAGSGATSRRDESDH